MRAISVFRLTTTIACLLAAASVAATSAAAAAARPELLISTEQLAELLGGPELVVLHVGADRESFDGGHVPGARFLEWSAVATARDGIPNEFPSRLLLRDTFAAAGVGDGSQVVLYDAAKGLLAARAFVALELIGFKGGVAVLDGQLAAWISENRPVQVGPPKAAEQAELTLQPADAVVVEAEDVRRALGGGGTELVDARSPAEWSGEKAGRDVAPARAGHLPGALNVPWTEHLAEGDTPRLKSLDELRALYAGIEAGAPVVVYCRTGVKASHAYFVLRLLGHRPHLYDGSYIEWHADPEAPIETAEGF